MRYLPDTQCTIILAMIMDICVVYAKFYSQFKPPELDLKHIPQGCLAGSVSRASDSWSGHEFGPHFGCRDHLIKLQTKQNTMRGKWTLTVYLITLRNCHYFFFFWCGKDFKTPPFYWYILKYSWLKLYAMWSLLQSNMGEDGAVV